MIMIMMMMMMMPRLMIFATLAHLSDTDCDFPLSGNNPEYSKFELRDHSFSHQFSWTA